MQYNVTKMYNPKVPNTIYVIFEYFNHKNCKIQLINKIIKIKLQKSWILFE